MSRANAMRMRRRPRILPTGTATAPSPAMIATMQACMPQTVETGTRLRCSSMLSPVSTRPAQNAVAARTVRANESQTRR